MQLHVAATVDVTLVGIIAENSGEASLQIKEVYDLVDLLREMESLHPFLKTINFDVSVNKTNVRKNIELKTGDQIAILPPSIEGLG